MAVNDPKRTVGSPKWSLAGAVAAAVGASACCVGPLMLLALGVGGAWVGTLTAMEKYRPIWTAATLVFLGGVKDAKVTLDPPRAVVIYDPAKVGPERLTEATTRAGYPSTVLQEGGTLR